MYVHCIYIPGMLIIVPSRASGGSGRGAAPVTSDSSDSHVTKRSTTVTELCLQLYNWVTQRETARHAGNLSV